MTTKQRSLLQQMDGFSFAVSYSKGSHPRAEQVAARCERAFRYLTSVLDFTPEASLLVLSPQDWDAHAAFQLYEMPHTAGSKTIVIGESAADFWQGIARMLDGVLTPTQRMEVEDIYGVDDGQIDIAPFADLLVMHELGHLFHEQVPFAFPRLWLAELFANLCLHACVVECEPDQTPVWTVLPSG